MATVVRMPEVLTGITEAAIQTWLVEPGQTVAVGTPLAEVETDKAVIEYAAETAGMVLSILVAAGDPVAIGDPIATIGEPGESVDDIAPSSGSAQPEPAPEPGPDARPARRFATPIVRRLARERGIDLDGISGTGPNGRIVRRDLEGADLRQVAQTAASPPPPMTAGTAAEFDEVPLTGMRRAIARRLTESTTTVPHFFLVADCRVDRLLALRTELAESAGVKASINDFVVKAVAGALDEVSEANATWGETVIRRHRSIDIAVAVAVEGGLVTPVVRGVDRLSLTQVSAAISDLAERAKAGRLRQDEIEGGSFSVSNLGMYGITEFSAIINPPHSGILAVGAARQQPVVDDGELAVGMVMTVTLSADHRVIDGALGARWLAAFQRRIEHPLTLLV